ncbi:MerR family transcriptional regulator [Aquabacterium sp. A7-Y]|uniref:MerR family transcriptional regulator n=1 Tax=Aquabacterium sp. A7-Y TaxID=1349605 RepID=UPI00223E6CD9|nr:MerR family transcriptional regulator [Aquabacterium sp. A7-Y]MCW7541406.1 MerR family transcriptional regulator [Aquabacterium sp. A7-Y]
MFRIGDFSRVARVSARLLRFYDEIGLLAPAHSDRQTGYRYYTIDQLAQLNRITVLKELGFSLEQVGDILRSPALDAAELRRMLQLRRNDAERAVALEEQRLRNIETRIAQIESEGAMSVDDVIERAEPARQLLSLRRTVASLAEGRALIGVLREQSRALLPKNHGCQLVAVAHSSQFESDEIDVEFGYTVDGLDLRVPGEGSMLKLSELVAVERMAVCVRIGLPEDAHLVTAKIGRFIAANGDVFDGPSREVFLQPPDPQRMHEAVVEMQFPLRRSCLDQDRPDR